MSYSGILHRVALVRTYVSEEPIASINRMGRIKELHTALGSQLLTANVLPNSLILFTLVMEALLYSRKSVRTIATRRNIPEGDILHCQRFP
jgi:hypothetical protein